MAKQYVQIVLALTLGLVSSLIAADEKPAPDEPRTVSELNASLKPARTIVYKKINGRELSLHLFEPKNWTAADRRPAYLAIHGGGWTAGSPDRAYAFADHFAKKGMVAMSLQYRLAVAGVSPADCAKDARSAVRYIRAHAAELGIDPDKIIVSGGSAGGHLAAGTALFDAVDESSDDLNISPVPAAIILYYPVIDTSTEGYGNARCGPNWKDISPVHRVKKGAPPTLIFHGKNDKTAPFKGSVSFTEQMTRLGNKCVLIAGEGEHSYLSTNLRLFNESLATTDEFLTSISLLPVK